MSVSSVIGSVSISIISGSGIVVVVVVVVVVVGFNASSDPEMACVLEAVEHPDTRTVIKNAKRRWDKEDMHLREQLGVFSRLLSEKQEFRSL